MKFINNLLSDNGLISSTRFMSILVCLTACFIAVWSSVNRISTLNDITLITALLTTAFTLKYKQKKVEVKK